MGRERGMGSIRMMTLCVINYDRSQGHMRKGMSVLMGDCEERVFSCHKIGCRETVSRAG